MNTASEVTTIAADKINIRVLTELLSESLSRLIRTLFPIFRARVGGLTN